jgi:hypothetical protein
MSKPRPPKNRTSKPRVIYDPIFKGYFVVVSGSFDSALKYLHGFMPDADEPGPPMLAKTIYATHKDGREQAIPRTVSTCRGQMR